VQIDKVISMMLTISQGNVASVCKWGWCDYWLLLCIKV